MISPVKPDATHKEQAGGNVTSARLFRQLYPRFCCLPPSLSAHSAGRSWPGGCYPPSPSRLRCERTRWCKRGMRRSHTISPPHTPCSPSSAQSPGRRHHCRRRCALTAPFHPLPAPHRRPSAGLLSVAVLRRAGVTTRAPPLMVSRGDVPPRGGRGVGKFLWRVAPAAARCRQCSLRIL